MKPLRILPLVIVVVSLSLSFVFYYQYQLKDRELAQYQKLSQLSSKALRKVSRELDKSWQEIEELNTTIAALEKDNLSYQGELQVLKNEKARLQSKIVRLIEEKNILEKNILLLAKKFRSLEELKEAIRIAKIEKRRKSKIERRQRRLAKIEMSKAMDKIALQQGNRGYLVRNSNSTFRPTKIRVELQPANRWSFRE